MPRCLQCLIYQISRSIGIVFVVSFGFRIWQCGRVLLSEPGRMPLPFLYHRWHLNSSTHARGINGTRSDHDFDTRWLSYCILFSLSLLPALMPNLRVIIVTLQEYESRVSNLYLLSKLPTLPELLKHLYDVHKQLGYFTTVVFISYDLPSSMCSYIHRCLPFIARVN